MAHRVFRDSSGRRWDVWNVKPSVFERRRDVAPAIPPAEERRRRHQARMKVSAEWVNGWLAFQTLGEKRRLADYPRDWMEVGDDALEQLCDRAIVVGVPRRLVE